MNETVTQDVLSHGDYIVNIFHAIRQRGPPPAPLLSRMSCATASFVELLVQDYFPLQDKSFSFPHQGPQSLAPYLQRDAPRNSLSRLCQFEKKDRLWTQAWSSFAQVQFRVFHP